MSSKNKTAFTLNHLDWDTDFFGVMTGKAILNQPLELKEWIALHEQLIQYELVMIENRDSEPINSQLIAAHTNAFISDIKIQLVKMINVNESLFDNVVVIEAMDTNNDVIDISDFQFSRFTSDPYLKMRGGDKVYSEWLMNSFNTRNKYFALYNNGSNGKLGGYALFSFTDSYCTIELFAVSNENIGKGIGKELFKAVEKTAHLRDVIELRVEAQFRNLRAINFYHKMGCRQVGCHEVYHLWNVTNLPVGTADPYH